MARGIRLATLGVEWLEAPAGRYNIGVRLRCLLHTNGESHWLVVTFANAYDGMPGVRIDGAVHALQIGGPSIGALTLTTESGDDVLDFGECGRLRIIRGRVTFAR